MENIMTLKTTKVPPIAVKILATSEPFKMTKVNATIMIESPIFAAPKCSCANIFFVTFGNE